MWRLCLQDHALVIVRLFLEVKMAAREGQTCPIVPLVSKAAFIDEQSLKCFGVMAKPFDSPLCLWNGTVQSSTVLRWIETIRTKRIKLSYNIFCWLSIICGQYLFVSWPQFSTKKIFGNILKLSNLNRLHQWKMYHLNTIAFAWCTPLCL